MNRRDKLAILAVIVIALSIGFAVEKLPALIDSLEAKYCKGC